MRNPVRLLLRVPVPWVFVLTYLVGVVLESVRVLGTGPAGGSRTVRIVGVVVFAIGATIAGWGLLLFRRARTTTVPGRSSATLVNWGPYLITRNPMYVGLTLAYLGEAGILRQVWPVVLLPLTLAYLNWIVIPLEEARLQEAFPGDYERYRSRVRRWI